MLNINRDHMIMHLLIHALLYLKVLFSAWAKVTIEGKSG